MNIFPGQMLGNDSLECSPRCPKAPGKSGGEGNFDHVLGGSTKGHDSAGGPDCQGLKHRSAQAEADQTGSALLNQTLDAEDRSEILEFLKAQGVSVGLLKDIESFLDQNPDLSLSEMLERVASLLEGAVSGLETALEDQARVISLEDKMSLKRLLDKCGMESREVEAFLGDLTREAALEDQASLKRLLDKCGMDSQEVEAALAELQQGDRIGFLDHLQSALSEHESSFGVSHQELTALLKSLGLDARGFKADGAHAHNLHQPGSEELNRLIELGKRKEGFSGQDLKALLEGLKESLVRIARPSEPKGEEIAHLARQLRQLLNSSEHKASAGELQQAGRPMPGTVRIVSDSAQNQAKDQDPDLKPGLKDLMARGTAVQSATTSGLGQEARQAVQTMEIRTPGSLFWTSLSRCLASRVLKASPAIFPWPGRSRA